MRTVVYGPEARKSLRRMPRNVAELMRGKLNQLASDPETLANNLSALKGTSALRLRIGDWRVILSIEPEQIIVHKIGPRGSIYR
jgi:mRNA interferase RelE/StbE